MDNGKNFGDQNLELWCGCKNSTMVDNGEGQIWCQKCGIVLNEDRCRQRKLFNGSDTR